MTAEAGLFNDALNSGSARDLRTMISAYFGGRAYEPIAPGTGAIGRGHGVLSDNAMLVSPQPTANNTVNVAPGFAVVRASTNDTQGSYFCPLESDETLEIADKHASLTRIDLVIARVHDSDYAGAEDEWEPEIVTGTAGAGVPTMPEDSLALAQITVAPGVGATVITSSAISDIRPRARVSGGITPVATAASFPQPKNYDVIYDISTSQFQMYYEGSWLIIGNDFDTNWQSYSPNLTGIITLGVGGHSWGRFKRYGKTVIGLCGFTGGGAGFAINSGTPLRIGLPSTAANPGGTDLHYLAYARAAFDGGPSPEDPAITYSGIGLIVPNTALIQFFVSYGTAPWIGPSNPGNWAAANKSLRAFFCYEEP